MTPTPQDHVDAPQMEEAVPAKLMDGNKVVISGMAGLYPKSRYIKDLENILYNKINPITDELRWTYNHPEVAQFTGNVPELDRFDAQFFKVNYRLGNCMDSMSRKLLEQAYEAIYDAGVNPVNLSGKKVAVYIGIGFSEMEKCFYTSFKHTGYGLTGCNKSMYANRISYWLNAKGPSMSIDVACCSSTTALEQAYQAITRGECEAAIVGGVYVCMHPQSSVHYTRMTNISNDGKTKSFTRDAAGCVKSEAINILFLQKAKDACRVYAEVVDVKSEYIRISNGETGPKYGFYRNTADSIKFMENFYNRAGVLPCEVEYVEAFGSAIADADESELEAIDKVYCKDRKEPLLVGNIMSNIGYGEGASGISAVTKVLLGYHRGELAGNLHYDNPRNDVAALREGRLQILTDNQRFRRTYAAVNNMSFTGINAHVLLHGRYKPKDADRYMSNIPRLVTISGRQESAVRRILNHLKSQPIDPEAISLLYNIHESRIPGHLGRGFIILDTDGEKETVSLKENVSSFDEANRPLWFVYSGMGSQWAGMGAQLMHIPVFAAAIDRCHRVLKPKGINITHIITTSDKNIFDNILHSFVGIAAVQIGLTDVLNELGLVPDNIIGHSVGELGCAYADGCLTAEEMILSAYSRGLVSLETPFIRGSMAAVGIGFEQMSKMCPPEIQVACHNSAESCTISGPTEAMRSIVTDLTARGIFAKEVPCSNIAYHSRYIADASPGLLKYLKQVIKTPRARSERWVSTSVPQDEWNEPFAKYSSAEYHTNNLLNPVLFEETSKLIPSNAVLVEVAPHGLLQAILKRSLPDSCTNIPLTRRGHTDNVLLLLEAIGKLYMEGYYPKVRELYPKVEFPVSTGTPFLSNLVEWAHEEKWFLPLYLRANSTTAASCTFVISIHDEEYNYFRGHVIRSKTLVPFSFALVATWDTLAMMKNVKKKSLCVQFHDVHLYAQPVLLDQRTVRLTVSLHKGSGRFEVMNENSMFATGFIASEEISSKKKEVSENEPVATKDYDLSAPDVYRLLYMREYAYSGVFRSIHNANKTLTAANILWKDNWVTFIDGLIQLNILKQTYDGVSQPDYIRKISINIDDHVRTLQINKKNVFGNSCSTVLQAEISAKMDRSMCGGVSIENIRFHDVLLTKFNDDQISLQSLKFVPRFHSQFDVKTSLCVLLQIVAEKINNNVVKVLGLKATNDDNPIFEEMMKISDESYVPGLRVHFVEQTEIKQTFETFDVVLLTRYALSNDISQYLFKIQNSKTKPFLIKIKDNINGESPEYSPNSYNVLSQIKSMTSIFDLVGWTPASETDFKTKHICGGEYYLPSSSTSIKTKNVKLQCRKIGDLDSIHWVHAPELDGVGILVEVHYAALHIEDVKKALGANKKNYHINHLKHGNNYAMEFSGVTQCGEKVMGLTPKGAASSHIIAQPELMWPVPEYWTLEDAATVPLAYVCAYYCIVLKSSYSFTRGSVTQKNVLVSGGAGAMGQAMISVALAQGYRIFATVADHKQKIFLSKQFPEIKDEDIGYSSDDSFGDIILSATKGQGCKFVICLTNELKNNLMKCCANAGIIFDIARISNNEKYYFGMNFLNNDRSYTAIDVFTIFKDFSSEELKNLMHLVSDGIARGHVRPLSRVTFAPHEAPRAFRLVAGAHHHGHVLLRMQDSLPPVQTGFVCSDAKCHVVFCDEQPLGLQLADTLIEYGVKKIYLYFLEPPSHLDYKLRLWKRMDVQVAHYCGELNTQNDVATLLQNASDLGNVEGVYVTAGNVLKKSVLTNLFKSCKTFCAYIKYFLLLDQSYKTCDYKNVLSSAKNKLPVMFLDLSMLKTFQDMDGFTWYRGGKEALEQVLRSNDPVMIAVPKSNPRQPLVHQIAVFAGLQLSDDTPSNVSLLELGLESEICKYISAFLRDIYNVSIDEKEILKLTVETLNEIDIKYTQSKLKEIKGLDVFYSYLDPDELLATTDIVPMPTLTHKSSMRDDEFDVNETFLCIVPGLEGHHARFRTLCERLKLPAFVLQPGLDLPNETLHELALRYSKIVLKRTGRKKTFYILGYETGVAVALELAAILEKHGQTGTVFCLGDGPEEIKALLEAELSDFQSAEALQAGVARHMFKLMAPDLEAPTESTLHSFTSWNARVDACIRALLGHVSHSEQYARAHIQTAYAFINTARQCNTVPRVLRSRIVLLRALHGANSGDKCSLQHYSSGAVVVRDLTAPLPHATADSQVPAIINGHLDDEILQAFDTKNLCDSYITNANSYMSSE